jgi:hypothetical protein
LPLLPPRLFRLLLLRPLPRLALRLRLRSPQLLRLPFRLLPNPLLCRAQQLAVASQ